MRSVCADLLLTHLDVQRDGPLNRRLYNSIRAAVLDGDLPPHSRLPPSRDLAAELGISRNTVVHAYEQLLAEGYLHARTGSGTFVSDTTPDRYLSSGPVPRRVQAAHAEVVLSAQGRALVAKASASSEQWGPFMPGVPDVTQFPHARFRRILSRLWRNPSPTLLTYGHGGGLPALREALCDYLRIARSVRCEPQQVLITEGVHQAIDLAVKLLVDPREVVWIEEPGYWGFHSVLKTSQARVHPVRVDGDGLNWHHVRQRQPPRLICVTPSHQYPLGSVMSLARRRELIDFARAHRAWIIEDDYDSEFRFAGHPVPSMQGLEDDTPVIYVGTFSKTLFPGLRLGYMVLPQVLAAPFHAAHADLYREGRLLTQAALAELLRDGHYAAHIRRMRVIYGRRRTILASLIERRLGPQYLQDESNAGLHLVLRLPDGCDDVAVEVAARAQGLLVRALSRYYQRSSPRRGLLLGYAAVEESQIGPAFETLLDCLKSELNS